MKTRLVLILGLLAGCAPQSASNQPDRPPATDGALQTNGTMDVARILRSPELAGKTIVTAGRCIGYSTPLAEGAAPQTRSDWQLEDAGAAIWVVGPFPAGCTGSGGDGTRLVVRARVAEDTIRLLQPQASKARRYLVSDR